MNHYARLILLCSALSLGACAASSDDDNVDEGASASMRANDPRKPIVAALSQGGWATIQQRETKSTVAQALKVGRLIAALEMAPAPKEIPATQSPRCAPTLTIKFFDKDAATTGELRFAGCGILETAGKVYQFNKDGTRAGTAAMAAAEAALKAVADEPATVGDVLYGVTSVDADLDLNKDAFLAKFDFLEELRTARPECVVGGGAKIGRKDGTSLEVSICYSTVNGPSLAQFRLDGKSLGWTSYDSHTRIRGLPPRGE
jgi:hypothetical protein